MKSLNDYFDKIYCVNLKRSVERWQACEQIFSTHNLNVSRFDAVDGFELNLENTNLLPGEYGCFMSHYNIIKECKDEKYNRVLILEDDVEFHPNLTELFFKYQEQLPEWDMLYFGGNHTPMPPILVSDNILKLRHTYTTHAYAVNSNSIDFIFSKMQNPCKQIDVIYAELQRCLDVYCFYPALAWQRDGYSYIHNTVVDYNFLRY
jgi:hypothetical protein